MVNETLHTIFNTIALIIAVFVIVFAFTDLMELYLYGPFLAISIVFVTLAGFVRR